MRLYAHLEASVAGYKALGLSLKELLDSGQLSDLRLLITKITSRAHGKLLRLGRLITIKLMAILDLEQRQLSARHRSVLQLLAYLANKKL